MCRMGAVSSKYLNFMKHEEKDEREPILVVLIEIFIILILNRLIIIHILRS